MPQQTLLKLNYREKNSKKNLFNNFVTSMDA